MKCIWNRGCEMCAIALVHSRDRHSIVGMLAQANDVLARLGRPPIDDVQTVDVESVPVGVTGKVLKRRLRQT